MLLFGEQRTVLLNRSNEAGRAVNCRSSFMGEGAMCFLSEDGDLRQAVSLTGARRVKGRGFADDDSPRFDESRGNEMSSTDATDLFVRGQNQAQSIDEARRIALGDRRKEASKKSLYVAGPATME